MSKLVKELLTSDLGRRLEGVQDALLVNVVGLNAVATTTLRKDLRQKNIHLLVVKNSLARRATEGTPLAGMADGLEGTLAIMWGSTDIVALAKEVVNIQKQKELEAFAPRGGILDGEKLSAEKIEAISKWPSRSEQLSILVGQMLSPGRTLGAQLLGPGGRLASQIKKKSEGEGEPAEAAPAAE